MKQGAPATVNLGGEGGFERAISREVSLLLQRANTKSNTNKIIDTNIKSNTNTIKDTNSI